MFKRLFGASDKEVKLRNEPSPDDQKILDAYAAYEDIRRNRSEIDRNYYLHRIEAARALLLMIPEGKFSDIREEVAILTAQEYEAIGLIHSPLYHGRNTEHQDNLRAIEDFSYAIEFTRLAGKIPEDNLFQRRGEHYLYQKMPDKAVDDATQAITYKETPEAYLLRAEAYSQMGNYVRAKADITYAMRIAKMFQQKGAAFVVFERICADVVADHRQNLEDLLRQYQTGKRDFRGIDLSWVDLSNVELPDIDLRGANLECSNLTGANFNRVVLRSANLSNTLCYRRSETLDYLVSFQDADLAGVNLDGAYLYKADFSRANLENAHMPRADIEYAQLTGANLNKAVLTGATLQFSDCDSASFVAADLFQAHLGCVNFRNAKLVGANLQQTDLVLAKLIEADLKGAQLQGAHLLEAVITHSSLVGADFSDTILAHANFSHSDLTGTSFVNADFSNTELTDALIDERELMKAMRLYDVRGLSEEVLRRWWKNRT
jgi:uncharacterized protein YjbI with pentapeptide repeats